MSNISIQQIKNHFDDREINLKRRVSQKCALAITKYEGKELKFKSGYTIYVPVGFEVVIKSPDGNFKKITSDEPYNPGIISSMWIIRLHASNIPWGVTDISYTDKRSDHKVQFGLNGEFEIVIFESIALIKKLSEPEEMSSLDIKNKMSSEMNSSIGSILRDFAFEHGFDELDKRNLAVAEIIKNALITLFGEYFLDLNKFTIKSYRKL